MPLAASYDAVIVGGGHNGLVAAGYLARAGRSCLVLERRSELGGAAVSERAFPGLDARLSRYAYLVSLLPRHIAADLGLDLRLARRRVSSYTPDPRADATRGLLVDAGDPAGTAASFARVAGSDRERAAWETLYATTSRAARRLFPTLTRPLATRAEMRALVGDDEAWRLLAERPLGESVAERFEDDLVAGVVLTDALIGTFADPHARDGLANRCFLYHVIGGGTGDWDVPVGGMGAVTAALVAAARGFGAELRTGAEVEAIEPASGGARVLAREGETERELRARHVLVNAAPAELDRLLGRPVPAGAARPEGAQLKVNMLLDRLPRLRDPAVAPEQAFAGTLHVNETASQLAQARAEAAAGRMPALAPCELYCHSLTDGSILGAGLRERGAHTLTLFALHMPARLFAADPQGARAAALEATLRSLDSVLAEPIAGCLASRPDGAPCLEVRSPMDLEAELRLPGGHIFHRDLRWPWAEDEADAGRWGVETDEPAVLLCGAGARRGGGVSGVPGHNAAMAVLRG